MKPAGLMLMLPLLLACMPPAHAQQATTIWRCVINGRIVYQEAPCAGRQVGARDRRTEAQKRAERTAQKREREKAAEAAASAASAAEPSTQQAAVDTGAPAAPVAGASAARRKP